MHATKEKQINKPSSWKITKNRNKIENRQRTEKKDKTWSPRGNDFPMTFIKDKREQIINVINLNIRHYKS